MDNINLTEFEKELRDKYGIESLDTYEKILKDCSDKELKLNDMEYQDIIDKYGIKMHYDSLRKSQQTPFGTAAATQYLLMKNDNKSSMQKAKDIVGEQYLLKKQLQNENNQIRKVKNDFVRAISVAEDVIEAFKRDGFEIPEYNYEPIVSSDNKTLVVFIGDWHIGYRIINCKGNYYNWEIANERINKLIDECYKLIRLYNIENVKVFNVGDQLEGTYMRQTQNQYCEFLQGEQIEKCIKLTYRFLTALSKECNVTYDGIAGNHDRVNGDKTANYDGDNANSTMTPVLAFLVEESKNKRIHIVERNYSDTEINTEINGVKFKIVHGHEHSKDDKNKIKNEISMDNEFFDVYVEGHYHNFRCLSENHGRYIITNGCLQGFNDYSTRFGCATCASQTAMIVENGKVELIKDIQLSD